MASGRWIQKAVPPAFTAMRVVGGLLTIGPGLVAIGKGYSLEAILFWFLLGMAGFVWLTYGLIRLGDQLEGLYEEIALGRLLADALDERKSAGVNLMTINEAVTLWKDVAPPTHRFGAHTKLRWLKTAAERGHFEATLQPNGTANMHCTLSVQSLAEMMRRKDWKALCVR